MRASSKDDDAIQLLSVAVRKVFDDAGLSIPSAHDVTQMLSDACWSGAVDNGGRDGGLEGRPTGVASSMKHSAVPTTLATPPWIEGDFESETHKRVSVRSVSSLA